jgi:hypothetical protein
MTILDARTGLGTELEVATSDAEDKAELERQQRWSTRDRRKRILDWCEYHERQIEAHRRTLTRLVIHHEAELSRYEDMLGEPEPRKGGQHHEAE